MHKPANKQTNLPTLGSFCTDDTFGMRTIRPSLLLWWTEAGRQSGLESLPLWVKFVHISMQELLLNSISPLQTLTWLLFAAFLNAELFTCLQVTL